MIKRMIESNKRRLLFFNNKKKNINKTADNAKTDKSQNIQSDLNKNLK